MADNEGMNTYAAEDEVVDTPVEEGGGEFVRGERGISYYHPETTIDYMETVLPRVPLQVVPPGQEGEKDPNHVSPPFLTVYERTKILGTRASQIADGARPFVTVPEHVTQPLEIAKLELEQRCLPFIIKRPMPDGTFENWRLSDLMIL